MNRNLRPRSALALLLFSLSAPSANAVTHPADGEYWNKTVPARPGGKLSLLADFGTVEILPLAVEHIAIEVFRQSPVNEHGQRGGKPADLELEVSSSVANHFMVRGEMPLAWSPLTALSNAASRYCFSDRCLSPGLGTPRTLYRVTVPLQFTVDVRTQGGAISVGALEGDVKAESEAGSIHVAGVHGSVRVHSRRGSIHLSGIEGNVTARSSQGNIEVHQMRGRLDAEADGGNVKVFLDTPLGGPGRLAASGGNIDLMLGPASGAALDARSWPGEVRSDFGRAAARSGRPGRWLAKVNGGGPRLVVRVCEGSIAVRRGPSASATRMRRESWSL